VLLEVSHRGSFTAAAETLGYTTSAISQQVAALEREVDALLVERGPRGVTLTEPGRILVAAAEDVTGRLAATQLELQALAGMRSGLLRLGWFATAGATLMPQAIALFAHRYPNVDLKLFQADPDECIPRLRSHRLELALMYRFELEPALAGEFEQTVLMQDPLHVGLPRDHRLATRARIQLADLAHDRWIQGVRHGSTVDVLPGACRLVGFEPDIAFQTDDRSAVEGLVAAGVGVALIPTMTVPTTRSDIVVRPLHARGLTRTVIAAPTPGNYRPPAVTAMLDILATVSDELVAHASKRIEPRSGA
jgi:DNA-binding transcriptional LysR family regulator